MRENVNMFLKWYKLCKPKWSLWLFHFATVAVPSICSICESMYTAKVTTSLADGNFGLAISCLVLWIIFVALREFSWDLNYRNTVL